MRPSNAVRTVWDAEAIDTSHLGFRPIQIYRLKRAKYLVCNIYDATLKIIAVAKVKANIVIHICSSIAWQAGAQPVSQPPAPGLSSSRWTGPQPMIRAACA